MNQHNVEIRSCAPIDVLAVDHVGPYPKIARAFEMLSGWIASRGLFGPGTRCLGIFYDDPDATPADQLRAKACFTLGPNTAAIDVAPPVAHVTITGGEHAIVIHKGPYENLKTTYDWLFGEWLPNSGREAADAPPFEIYLNAPDTTKPEDLLTEIHLPLR